MDFVVITTDLDTGLLNFALTEHVHGGPLNRKLSDMIAVFGTYENVTIFFATPNVATWKTYCLSMQTNGMISPERAEISIIDCEAVEESFPKSPSPEESMNYIRARMLWGVLRVPPITYLIVEPETSYLMSFLLWLGVVGKNDTVIISYTIENKAELIKDFDTLGVALEVQAVTGVSDKVYDEQLLNRIIDNPFIEKDLQKIWYARPKKELPDASDIRLLEQICFESVIRKRKLLIR